MKMPALVELKTAAPSFDRCAEIARVVPLQEGCELVITDTMIRLIAQNGAEFTFYRGDCARAVTEGMFTCLMALRAAPAPHYVEMGRKGDKVNTHKVIGIDHRPILQTEDDCELCDPEQANLFSVYAVLAVDGWELSYHYADHQTLDAAKEQADLLAQVLNVVHTYTTESDGEQVQSEPDADGFGAEHDRAVVEALMHIAEHGARDLSILSHVLEYDLTYAECSLIGRFRRGANVDGDHAALAALAQAIQNGER